MWLTEPQQNHYPTKPYPLASTHFGTRATARVSTPHNSTRFNAWGEATPIQGDRKGLHPTQLHPRPYNERLREAVSVVIVRAGAVGRMGRDPCGRPGTSLRLLPGISNCRITPAPLYPLQPVKPLPRRSLLVR